VALPDALAFAGADEATLNAGGSQEFRKSADFCLAFWKVAAD
jgi:hypothetical protein